MCWINEGFCALALGNDKSVWGIGYTFGSGANSADASNNAINKCKKLTTDVHVVLCLSSDGQYIWKPRHERTTAEAISEYTKAIELDPKNAEAYNNRGAAYNDSDQFDKAISDCSKAIELNPKLAEAYCNRGMAYNNTGQPIKAISDCTHAIVLNTKLAGAYCNRAIAYKNLGQADKALSDYAKTIELDPKNVLAYQ